MDTNGSTPKLKVLRRVAISKAFIASNKLKPVVDAYVKTTGEFAAALQAQKDASEALKKALEPKIADKIDLTEGTDWKAVQGDDGTIIIQVIEKQAGRRRQSSIPTDTL